MQFGLIGKSLSHSFSKAYFEKKFRDLGLKENSYQNFDLSSIEELDGVLSANKELKGLNVTAPYKEQIIPYLTTVDADAKIIGAVNCVKIEGSNRMGFNTDVYGFKQSIKPFLEPKHSKALILGTGGSSKAVAYVLKQIGVEVFFVTTGKKLAENYFLYSELNEMIVSRFLLIINCTPLGMFPEINNYPNLPYQYVGADHLAYDLIYNPAETLFLKKCKENGAVTINGLSMLQLQAEKSWEIWTS